MRAEFKLTYDYLWRVQRAQALKNWKRTLLAIVLVAIGVGIDWFVFNTLSWISIVGLVALGILLLVKVLLLLRGRGFARYYVSVQGDEPVSYEFADEHLATKSKHAELVVPWGTMRSLTRGPHHWLLHTASGAALTLPVAQMSDELKAHVVSLARKFNLRIRG